MWMEEREEEEEEKGKKKSRGKKREVNIWVPTVFTIRIREEHMLVRNMDKVDLLEGRRRRRVE